MSSHEFWYDTVRNIKYIPDRETMSQSQVCFVKAARLALAIFAGVEDIHTDTKTPCELWMWLEEKRIALWW